jgi:predicted dehydrogenase
MTKEPLRIGVLGAARISEMTLFPPARDIGARVVAVAARDRRRAEAYAAEHGIERVADDYAALIADPEVEAVYNPLPNSLHTVWNLAAIEAGKHVLGEKPFASNAREAEQLHRAAQAHPELVVFDGLHYRYHPVFQRLQEIVRSGEIGEVQQVRAVMTVPVPDVSDIRWSWPLAGGSMMDLGIYCIDVIHTLSADLGGLPKLTSATTGHLDGTHPHIDSWSELSYELPNGGSAVAEMNLIGPQHFVITVVGSRGTAHQANLSYVHTDDRVLVFTAGTSRVEELGRTSSFIYQMRAFESAIRDKTPYPTNTEQALLDLGAVDAAYEMAGLPPRPSADDLDG